MALVLPMAMSALLGIFTGGNAYFMKISMVDAAREGARYGASLKAPGGSLPDWRQAVRIRVATLSGGQVEASDVCAELVVPTLVTPNTACGIPDPAGAASDPSILTPASVVKVSVRKGTKLEFLFFSSNKTLSAGAAARYERDIL